MIAAARRVLTHAQYLALEASSDAKHEYLRGEAWAMAGGTPRHAKLAANVTAALTTALRGKPCGVFSADLRIRVEETDRTTYPDVTVVCGKREIARDDELAVVNPVVIVEVLSDATEASDRGEKFAHLQRLPSLQEYVLVSQAEPRIEVFRRGAGTTWVLTPHTGGRVELASLGVALDFAELYADPTA
ncbi:MAG: Uma2 family endonuclease [Polyangiaceae bacterium]|nr:Uma2 family endonuclease [Polyangiaceae bacterium]